MFPILLSVLLVLWLPFEVIAIKSTMYNGTLNTTVFGTPCQQWKSDSPHAHIYNNLPENYCRDPSASNFLWCYTTDPQVRWDICDPRVLTESYTSILSNNTGSACIREECCNLTWKSFKNVYRKCDPRMFVKLWINYRVPNKGYYKFKYVVPNFFTSILDTNWTSTADCMDRCNEKTECIGYIFYRTNDKRCHLGKFNSHDAIKTVTDIRITLMPKGGYSIY